MPSKSLKRHVGRTPCSAGGSEKRCHVIWNLRLGLRAGHCRVDVRSPPAAHPGTLDCSRCDCAPRAGTFIGCQSNPSKGPIINTGQLSIVGRSQGKQNIMYETFNLRKGDSYGIDFAHRRSSPAVRRRRRILRVSKMGFRWGYRDGRCGLDCPSLPLRVWRNADAWLRKLALAAHEHTRHLSAFEGGFLYRLRWAGYLQATPRRSRYYLRHAACPRDRPLEALALRIWLFTSLLAMSCLIFESNFTAS